MFKKLANHIWVAETDFNMAGLEIGGRMTVVDLDGEGSLFVHSPVRLNEEIKKGLDQLGVVRVVVAPNKMHHMFIGDYKALYPQARYYGAPGLEKKRADFAFDGVISEQGDFPWSPVLQHHVVQGIPTLNEVVFFDARSSALIVTDLALNVQHSKSLYTRLVLRLIGALGHFGWSKIEKKIFIKNPVAFRQSLETILAWNFEKIVLAHGELILENGGQKMREVYLASAD